MNLNGTRKRQIPPVCVDPSKTYTIVRHGDRLAHGKIKIRLKERGDFKENRETSIISDGLNLWKTNVSTKRGRLIMSDTSMLLYVDPSEYADYNVDIDILRRMSFPLQAIRVFDSSNVHNVIHELATELTFQCSKCGIERQVESIWMSLISGTITCMHCLAGRHFNRYIADGLANRPPVLAPEFDMTSSVRLLPGEEEPVMFHEVNYPLKTVSYDRGTYELPVLYRPPYPQTGVPLSRVKVSMIRLRENDPSPFFTLYHVQPPNNITRLLPLNSLISDDTGGKSIIKFPRYPENVQMDLAEALFRAESVIPPEFNVDLLHQKIDDIKMQETFKCPTCKLDRFPEPMWIGISLRTLACIKCLSKGLVIENHPTKVLKTLYRVNFAVPV